MRKSLGSWALTATLATLAVAGCGGGGSSTTTTPASFCDQKAQKECQVTTKCGTTTNACLAQRTAKCLDFAAAALADRMRQFTAANIGACINATASVYAKAMITPTDLANMDDVCSSVFRGTSTAMCTVKYDCAVNLICDGQNLCSKALPKSKGAACGDRGSVCAVGSYCTQDPAIVGQVSLICLAKGGQGVTCDDATAPCLENLRCDAATHTCLTLRPAGDTCISSAECAAAAPYCDPYIGNKCDVGLIFAPTATAACADYGGTNVGIGGAPGIGGASGGGSGGSTGSDASTD